MEKNYLARMARGSKFAATDDLLLVHGAKARATAVFDVRGPRGAAAVDVGGAVHGLRLLPPDLARDAGRDTKP